MPNRGRGLTLVELVVGLCALGTLLSISLPAIQWGQEAADRNRCQLNLRMIGLASHEYDDAFGELPPYMGIPGNLPSTSAFNANVRNYQLTYSLTQLLDFVGYSNLAKQVDPFAFSSADATIQSLGYNNFDNEWLSGISPKLPGIEAIAFDVQIPEFRCPTDAGAPTDTVFAGPHPTDSAFAIALLLQPIDGIDYSVTNYAANVGAVFINDNPFYMGFHGPIRSRRSDSVDTIPDGASNVILFGESLGTINPSSSIRYSMAMGGLACGRASNYPSHDTNFGTLKESSWIQFASGHPDAVNFLFVGGSVRSLDRNISTQLIGRLCGVADGIPVLGLTGN